MKRTAVAPNSELVRTIPWQEDPVILERMSWVQELWSAGQTVLKTLEVVNGRIRQMRETAETDEAREQWKEVGVYTIREDRGRLTELARESIFKGVEGHLADLDFVKRNLMTGLQQLPRTDQLPRTLQVTTMDAEGKTHISYIVDPRLVKELVLARTPFWALFLRASEDQQKLEGLLGDKAFTGGTKFPEVDHEIITPGEMHQRGLISTEQYRAALKVLHLQTQEAMRETGQLIDIEPTEVEQEIEDAVGVVLAPGLSQPEEPESPKAEAVPKRSRKAALKPSPGREPEEVLHEWTPDPARDFLAEVEDAEAFYGQPGALDGYGGQGR